MALVNRDGRAYSYRSVRRNGRVTSEYRGSGEAALLMEGVSLADRYDEEIERSESRADREGIEKEERLIADYFDAVEDLARAALLASGFHRHNREWRRRRERREDT